MERIWFVRLRNIAAGLLSAMLAALTLAGILRAAGDTAGSEALFGFAVVTAVVFISDLCVLVLWLGRIYNPATDDTKL